ILRCFPHTLLIVVLAMAIALLVGIPLGVFAASRQGGPVDTLVMGVASVGVAVPNFWLGMLLVSYFALEKGWLPATGAVSLHDS
ncbi:ABC transporter permease subunit, partial [Enterobacter hormaechei]|uniref:ABC transporter permease subunit n=1 Tax=Enterobacter hormaechei TaxID=158836 RepID=UPI0013D6AB07